MSARVLVIDDLEVNLKLLESKLASEYYDVVTAKSGQEGLDIINTQSVDIILLDIKMPGMDGFETCKKIKSDKRHENIPVVMLTSLGDGEERINGLNAGADDFISRPIIGSSLFARIESLVRIKRIMDELVEKGVQAQSHEDGNKELLNNISQANVLIIDDDITQLENLKFTIEKITKNIVIADEFPLDLAKYLNSELDLIIISTQLIEEDGLRICSKIINNPKLKEIPILILAEEGDEATIVKALDIRVSDYLLTPIDESEANLRIFSQLKRKKLQDKLKESYEKNISLASTDALTGLYNRHYFDSHSKQIFETAIASGTPLSLMIIDLDHFKSVNDKYGHQVGDEVIEQTAERIKKNSRITDLAARYGGEEFVVLMPETNLEGAKILAERLKLAIMDEPYKITHAEKILKKTCSIGVAELKHGKEAIDELVARADKGLYIAKEHGRNLVIATN